MGVQLQPSGAGDAKHAMKAESELEAATNQRLNHASQTSGWSGWPHISPMDAIAFHVLTVGNMIVSNLDYQRLQYFWYCVGSICLDCQIAFFQVLDC